MSTATEISKTTSQEAKEILTHSNYIQIVKKYGDLRVGGSFYTGLMYGPDIDFSIASPNPRKAALGFLNEVIQNNFFQKYQYGNFEDHPRQNRLHGHMVVLILEYKGRKWEIETWFLKKHVKAQIAIEEKLYNLSIKDKNKIIELKHKREINGLDKHSLSSHDIYLNFLKRNAKS